MLKVVKPLDILLRFSSVALHCLMAAVVSVGDAMYLE